MKNKWFCIGKSGATVDGRHIEAETLKQMAESYNPHLAQIWLPLFGISARFSPVATWAATATY